jgi:hypothetical protein
MFQAIITTSVVPDFERPWKEPAMVMKLLDAGSHHVICPMTEGWPTFARRTHGGSAWQAIAVSNGGRLRSAGEDTSHGLHP